jgi:hypothetical protein
MKRVLYTSLLLLFAAAPQLLFSQKILQDWTKHLKAVPAGSQFSARAGVDDKGDPYWCSNSQNDLTGKYEVHLVKYDSSGVLQWSNHYEGAGGLTMTDFQTLANGASYVYGIDYGAGTGSSQAGFVQKHDAQGNLLWSFTFDPVFDLAEYPDQFYISPLNGDVIFTATVMAPQYSLVVARYSQDGQFVWQTSFPGYEAGDIMIDANDQIHLLNTYHWGSGESDIAFDYLKLDGNGNWLAEYKQTGGQSSHALATAGKGRTIGLDEQGNVYALAWVESFPNSDTTWTNIMIKKFNVNGEQEWKKRLEVVQRGYPKETATLLTDAATGESIILGGWGMWKYNATGEFVNGWYDSRRNYIDACQFDQQNLFPVSSGQLVMDGDSGKLALVDWSDDYPDLYVKGRASIQPLNKTAIIEPDAAHKALYVTWSFNDSVSLHRVVLRDDVATPVNEVPQNIIQGLYPNPASDHTTVFLNDAARLSMLQVFDAKGTLILQQDVSQQKQVSLDLKNRVPGYYSVVVTSDGNRSRYKLIVLR